MGNASKVCHHCHPTFLFLKATAVINVNDIFPPFASTWEARIKYRRWHHSIPKSGLSFSWRIPLLKETIVVDVCWLTPAIFETPFSFGQTVSIDEDFRFSNLS
jgi:hypothetical protein